MGIGTISRGIALLLVIPSVAPLAPAPSVVKVKFGNSATLPCDGSAYRGFHDDQLSVLWRTVNNVEVAHYSPKNQSMSSLFSNRVRFLMEDIRLGNFSLIISSVVFSDLDTYECVWENGGSQIVLNDVRLYVLEPLFSKSLSVPVGDSVTLPCFGSTNKQAADELSIQWKRGEELVLNLSSGVVTYSPIYKGRTSVPFRSIRKGNFSLSLNVTGPCDSGVYHCSVDQNKNVTSVTLKLTDYGNFKAVNLIHGTPFPFSLPGEPVKVIFSQEATLPKVPSCSLVKDVLTCESKYWKWKNNTLLNVTLKDVGRYLVINSKNCVISRAYRVNVQHSHNNDNHRRRFFIICPVILFVVTCIVLGVCMNRKRKNY